MENDDNNKTFPENIPYIAHEAEMARSERKEKRFFIIIILLIALLVGTNAGWIWYESQFEDVTQTVEQEAESGTNNFVGGDMFGESEDNNQNS